MNPTDHQESARRLKRVTYSILDKMHDLEKGRKFCGLWLRKSDDNEYLVSTCVNHLRVLLNNSLNGLNNEVSYNLRRDFFVLFDKFSDQVRQSLSNKKVVNKGALPELLVAHTRLFKCLLEEKIKVTLQLVDLKNVILTAVMLWGNKIKIRL